MIILFYILGWLANIGIIGCIGALIGLGFKNADVRDYLLILMGCWIVRDIFNVLCCYGELSTNRNYADKSKKELWNMSINKSSMLFAFIKDLFNSRPWYDKYK